MLPRASVSVAAIVCSPASRPWRAHPMSFPLACAAIRTGQAPGTIGTVEPVFHPNVALQPLSIDQTDGWMGKMLQWTTFCFLFFPTNINNLSRFDFVIAFDDFIVHQNPAIVNCFLDTVSSNIF